MSFWKYAHTGAELCLLCASLPNAGDPSTAVRMTDALCTGVGRTPSLDPLAY